MNEDFFRNIFKCCLYITLSAFVLIAAYATLDLVVDGMDYREKGCNINKNARFSAYPVAKKDPLGLFDKEDKEKVFNLATGKWEYEVKVPSIPKEIANSRQFRAWLKTLTPDQRNAVKSKYLEVS